MAEATKGAEATPAQGAVAEVSEFEKLLEKGFKPKTDKARENIRAAVQTLAEQALAGVALISDDSIKTIESIIAEIDKKLTQQVNQILHHDDFKKLEGAWRGLHH